MKTSTFRLAGVLAAALALSACSGLSGGSSDTDSLFGSSSYDELDGGLASGGVLNDGLDTFGIDPVELDRFQSEIGDRIRFATDSSSLDFVAMEVLRGQAAWLREHPMANAVIEGHADERGTRDYNLALGARRAAAVRNFLVAEGVSPDQLNSATYGKERPEAPCSDESCWSTNRRAVTVFATGPMG